MTTLAVQQALTAAMIADDPTDIVLTPYERTVTAGGGTTYVAGQPRESQTFKLIPMTFDQRPTVTAGGVERIIDYTLLGTADAIGEVWDQFVLDDPSEYFLIVAIAPGHGYETKFLCERHRFQDKVT